MNEAAFTDLRHVLSQARVIAVLGAHHEAHRAAFYVPEYMHQQGARVLPVNPQLVGRTLWGEPVRATLAELGAPVDVVDVFRRSELLESHLDDLLAMAPRPRVVWLQQGISHPRFSARLRAEGIEVVEDRCMLADHRRLGLGRIE
jgi:predicted CoA-binding protein